MLRDIGIKGTVKRTIRLRGGMGAATHALEVASTDDGVLRLVLKTYDPVDDEGAAREWECLQFLVDAAVPAPTPVGLDLNGDWFKGLQSLLMTRIPGRTHMSPRNLNRYLSEISQAIEMLRSIDTSKVPDLLAKPEADRVATWKPPTEGTKGPLAEKILQKVAGLRPTTDERVFVHSDFHPVNLVWVGERLGGIADWSSACLGHPWFDLSYCRIQIALLFGTAAAEKLVTFTEKRIAPATDLPLLDLLCGLNAIRWSKEILDIYRGQGRRDLTMNHYRQRLRVFVERALAKAG